MTPWVHHILAATLTAAIEILPEPGEKFSLQQAWRTLGPRPSSLHYKISQQQLSLIFRTHNMVYIPDPDNFSVEVRDLAGHHYIGQHQEVHGFGETRALHAPDFSIYFNAHKTGFLGGGGGLSENTQNIATYLQSHAQNISSGPIHARGVKRLFTRAYQCESPGPLYQISVIACIPDQSDAPLFSMRADFVADPQQASSVTIHHISRPVLDDQGHISYGHDILADSPDAPLETLKFLIFIKLATHRMVYRQPVDLERILHDVANMSLHENSKIQDYLSLAPHP